MLLFTIMCNFYCLLTLCATQELHSADYFLVGLQSAIDLVFGGTLPLVYYVMDVTETIVMFCGHSGFWEDEVTKTYP